MEAAIRTGWTSRFSVPSLKRNQVLASSAGWFAVDRLGNRDRREPFAPNFNFDGRARFRELRRHIAHANADAERWALRAAHHFADLLRVRAGAPDRIMRPWRRR